MVVRLLQEKSGCYEVLMQNQIKFA